MAYRSVRVRFTKTLTFSELGGLRAIAFRCQPVCAGCFCSSWQPRRAHKTTTIFSWATMKNPRPQNRARSLLLQGSSRVHLSDMRCLRRRPRAGFATIRIPFRVQTSSPQTTHPPLTHHVALPASPTRVVVGSRCLSSEARKRPRQTTQRPSARSQAPQLEARRAQTCSG